MQIDLYIQKREPAMKFSAYQNELQQDAEFVKASEELKLTFTLANAILRARIKKGWSQHKLAKAVGTKQANISRIESGLANPTISLVNKLMGALELDIEIGPIAYPVELREDYGTTEVIEVKNWPKPDCNTSYSTKSEASSNGGNI
jgi:XRE family transcriptional regulator, regulator of sulfur utilization